MKLDDIITKVDKEQGFYITYTKQCFQMKFSCSDHFYEYSGCETLLKKEVLFITTKNNKLYILLED